MHSPEYEPVSDGSEADKIDSRRRSKRVFVKYDADTHGVSSKRRGDPSGNKGRSPA